MSSTVAINGVVTDSVGATYPFSTTVTLSSFTGVSAVVTPANAPAGTTRTLTLTASGATPPYGYPTPTGPGLTFTPVSGQPGKWTFVL